MPKFTWKVGAAIAVTVLLASIPVSHFMILHSDAYAAAQEFIYNSPEVAEAVGTVRSASIPVIGPSIRIYGSRGSAEFDVTVSGEKDAVVVLTSLEKRGIWNVVRANLVSESGQVSEMVVLPANNSLQARRP